MAEQFWIGVGVFPAAVLIYVALGWLLVASRRVWAKVHDRMMEVINVQGTLDVFGPDDQNEYEDAAEIIKQGIMKSPKVYTIIGLGWIVAIVRDAKAKEDAS